MKKERYKFPDKLMDMSIDKMGEIQLANPKAKRKFWMMFDPYKEIVDGMYFNGLDDVNCVPKGTKFVDPDGIEFRVCGFGGGTYFGKGSCSFQWVAFYLENTEFKHDE